MQSEQQSQPKKQTTTIIGEFKGNPVFEIWALDEFGDKAGRYPVVSFGLAKAKAIVENEEALKKFIAENQGK